MLHPTTHTPQELWKLGYTHNQLPIMSHDAIPAPGSSLAKKVAAAIAKGKGDPRGKAPGIKVSEAHWLGMRDWRIHQASEKDIALWGLWKAGTGIRMGTCGSNHLAFIDVDSLDPALVAIIHKEIGDFFDIAAPPRRVGRDPRCGYLIRTAAPVNKRVLRFGAGEKVEVLGEGQQFVAIGIHPVTKLPYHWPTPLVAVDELPLLTLAQLQQLLDKLATALPDPILDPGPEGNGSRTDPEDMCGDLDSVREAVSKIPNDLDYDAWIKMLYAIKGATGDPGLSIALEFSNRWTDGDNDQDEVIQVYRGLKPERTRGASYLYELAEPHGFDANAARAKDFFRRFNTDEEQAKAKAQSGDPRIWNTVELWDAPKTSFLIQGLIPAKTVGLMTGESQTFKSFIAQDWALAIAAGSPEHHGHAIQAPQNAMVLYIAGEGGIEAAAQRMRAWAQFYGYTKQTLRDHFKLIASGVNLMEPTSVNKLVQAVKANITGKLVLVIIDTINMVAAGAEENSSKEMGILYATCRKIGITFECAVMGVHHVNKSGGVRGSALLTQNADFLFSISRTFPSMRTKLTVDKLKDAPIGYTETYKLELIALDNECASLVPIRIGKDEEEEINVGGRPAKRSEAILASLTQTPTGYTEIYAMLGITTKREQQAVRRCLRRLVEDGRVIRAGEKYHLPPI